MTTLSDINNFITLQSDANISDSISGDTSALTIAMENVSINSNTRRYEEEIHFTNPDNTYCGDFTTVDKSTGKIINLTTAVSNVLNINSKLREITNGYEQGDTATYNNSKVYTDKTVGNIENNLMEYVSSYIDNTISYLNNDTAVKLANVIYVLNTHTAAEQIHVSENERHLGKINAGYLDGYSVESLAKYIADMLITHTDTSGNIIDGMLSKIDCGIVSGTVIPGSEEENKETE